MLSLLKFHLSLSLSFCLFLTFSPLEDKNMFSSKNWARLFLLLSALHDFEFSIIIIQIVRVKMIKKKHFFSLLLSECAHTDTHKLEDNRATNHF